MHYVGYMKFLYTNLIPNYAFLNNSLIIFVCVFFKEVIVFFLFLAKKEYINLRFDGSTF